MILISIGTDRKLFEKDSVVGQRTLEYGKFFEEMHIVVFTTRVMNYNSRVKISDKIFVYPTNSCNKLFYVWDAFLVIKKLFKKIKPKIENSYSNIVVSCQDPFETGLVGVFMKLFFNLPLHIQIHTDFKHKYFRQVSFLNTIRSLMSGFVVNFADRVRVVSERVKRSIEPFSKNVDILPIKVELKTKDYEFKKEQKEMTNLLTVCRLEKEKNLETAIKAFKMISEKFSEATFTIVGDGSERRNLEKLCEDLSLKNKVIFVGWQNDLTKYYKEASIYISTSMYEGYGISVVEAGSFGKALVLSDTGLAGDVFKNEDSALICDALDTECFAENILRLFKDKNLIEKMGERAKEETLKHLEQGEDYFEKYANAVKKTVENFETKNIFLRVLEFVNKFFNSVIYARYFICGLTSASLNILMLYIFTDKVGIWYLYSSMLAFVFSTIISFTLQKFVVFKDRQINGIYRQFFKFVITITLGVVVNTCLVFNLVSVLGIWYILSQVIAGIFVMIQNFLIYRIIFKKVDTN
ncbi:MAG: glycosyltransferase [Parcubacteria group bacterium]|nr:glycosyltransferase [Parcubacteria group bacterium]